jgi:hypothetical protein
MKDSNYFIGWWESFKLLVDLVGDQIKKEGNNCRKAMSVKERKGFNWVKA